VVKVYYKYALWGFATIKKFRNNRGEGKEQGPSEGGEDVELPYLQKPCFLIREGELTLHKGLDNLLHLSPGACRPTAMSYDISTVSLPPEGKKGIQSLSKLICMLINNKS
jgi:hypothetical protein